MNYGLAAICLFLFVAAAFTAATELQPFLAGTSNDARLAVVKSGTAPTGPSLALARNAAEECLWAINSPAGLLQPEASRLQTLDACEATFARLENEHPALSVAYLLGATIAAQRLDSLTLSELLVRSRTIAPQSQAMARIRTSLASARHDELSEAARRAESMDLALLLTSEAGISYLAPRYIADGALRERVRPLLDGASPEYRARFVSMLGHLTESPN